MLTDLSNYMRGVRIKIIFTFIPFYPGMKDNMILCSKMIGAMRAWVIQYMYK